jgi:hypothetical protein
MGPHNKDQSFLTNHSIVQSLRYCRSTVAVEAEYGEDLRTGLEVEHETWLLGLEQRQRGVGCQNNEAYRALPKR